MSSPGAAAASIPTVIGALLASVALLGNSGSLFADWMHLEFGTALDLEEAAAISDAVLVVADFRVFGRVRAS
jgi:hypothetical protein